MSWHRKVSAHVLMNAVGDYWHTLDSKTLNVETILYYFFLICTFPLSYICCLNLYILSRVVEGIVNASLTVATQRGLKSSASCKDFHNLCWCWAILKPRDSQVLYASGFCN